MKARTPRDERWHRCYDELWRYTQEHGTSRVPASHVTKGGIRLGAWVGYVRNRHHKGLLPEKRVQALCEIPGWQWGPLPPGPQKGPYPRKFSERDETIRHLYEHGRSLQQIGSIYGLSRQRIHQIVREPL